MRRLECQTCLSKYPSVLVNLISDYDLEVIHKETFLFSDHPIMSAAISKNQLICFHQSSDPGQLNAIELESRRPRPELNKSLWNASHCGSSRRQMEINPEQYGLKYHLDKYCFVTNRNTDQETETAVRWWCTENNFYFEYGRDLYQSKEKKYVLIQPNFLSRNGKTWCFFKGYLLTLGKCHGERWELMLWTLDHGQMIQEVAQDVWMPESSRLSEVMATEDSVFVISDNKIVQYSICN